MSEQHRAAGIDIVEDEAQSTVRLHSHAARDFEGFEEKAASADAYTLTIRDDEYVDSVLPADTASVEVPGKDYSAPTVPQPIDHATRAAVSHQKITLPAEQEYRAYAMLFAKVVSALLVGCANG